MTQFVHDLLIEIGTEELPPRALTTLQRDFEDLLCRVLREARLDFSETRAFATPRRLAVLIHRLDEHQAEQHIEKKGPALKAAFKEGQPTRAAQGFARSCGVAVEDLETDGEGDDARLVFRRIEPGADTVSLLPALVDSALRQLPVPRQMRWGTSRTEFVRPVHWVVLLYGEQAVEGEVMGIPAGRSTRGHRFHANQPLELELPGDYESVLEDEGRVIADFDRRRERIATQVREAAARCGGNAVVDEALLDEVTALVEWPVALAGTFEERFLTVPPEALISSMKEHQKYFHVVDTEDRLLPCFITVANIESRDPEQVVRGNERVIRPRLADAAFFFDTDCRVSLAERREQLKSVVFQEKLGTLYDKTERIAALARQLAPALDGDPALAARAGELSKSDLVTEMVHEFPDLQGIAGYYYARNDGESEALASALTEQYLPRFAGDELPRTAAGSALALGDRLDTVVGIFGIGQPPSGSRDPFALRRASLGILRILIEQQRDLDLRDAVRLAIAGHGELPAADGLEQAVLDYMLERLRAWYEDRGIATEVFLAVTAKHLSHPLDIDRRVQAVQAFSQLPESGALVAANKRVSNLLAKSEAGAGATVDASLLREPAERTLAEAVTRLRGDVAPLFAEARYTEALQQLAGLREQVDTFFDQVMVMAEDTALRDNRLALLATLRELFLNVADISLLVLNQDEH